MKAWARLVSFYNRVRGRRYWQASSPAGTLQLGFLTAKEAISTVREAGGKVAFVDQEHAVVIYDTHLAIPQNQQDRS